MEKKMLFRRKQKKANALERAEKKTQNKRRRLMISS
jgi:hypothetical protein